MFSPRFISLIICFMMLSSFTFSQRRVSVRDQGSNMQISSFALPNGWNIDADISTAFQDYTRYYHHYKFDFNGPRQAIIRNVAPVQFSSMSGPTFEQALQSSMQQQLRPLGNFQGSAWTSSQTADYLYPQLAQMSGLQFFECRLVGSRRGQAMEGVYLVMLSNGQFSGSFTSMIILAPQGSLQQTIQTTRQILNSKHENPRYAQLMQQKRQQYIAYTNGVMRDRDRQFQQSQKTLRDMAETRSQINRQFNADIKRWGDRNVGNQNSSYSSNDAFNDHIKGTTSFNDGYYGHQISVQGEYDYWFTDGYGRYYGTDDPGFDTASINGDWRKVEPLR